MQKPPLAALAAILLTTACADYDLRALSTTEPLPNGTIRWRTMADAIYPADDPRAEAKRLEQLGKVMTLNDVCAAGYDVLDRRVLPKVEGAFGTIADVYYTVRCR